MIVISNPTATANEISTIHALFENGMELFHIRKPEFSEKEMKAFIEAIGLDYKDKLVLHSHHQRAEDFGINRIHFSENKRKETIDFTGLDNFVLSTSTHSIEEFNLLSNVFDYAFLSPVFPSISKENYQSETDLFEAVKRRTNFNTKLVALGGISATNSKQTLEKGFNDVALLGNIWNSDKPIENFKSCQQIVLSF